jgi:hypothetical protein
MRTTVTLEPDVAALIKKAMRERDTTFKTALNDAVRAGLTTSSPRAGARTRTFKMGYDPALPWDKALRLAADLEDEELARRIAARK